MMKMMEMRGFERAPPAAQLFGNAGKEHMEKFGTKAETLAKIAEKNHRHSSNNPIRSFATFIRLTRSWLRSKSLDRSQNFKFVQFYFVYIIYIIYLFIYLFIFSFF